MPPDPLLITSPLFSGRGLLSGLRSGKLRTLSCHGRSSSYSNWPSGLQRNRLFHHRSGSHLDSTVPYDSSRAARREPMAKTKATKPRIAKRKAAVKQARGAKVERRATPRGTTVGKRHAARARRTVAKQTSDLPDLDLIE